MRESYRMTRSYTLFSLPFFVFFEQPNFNTKIMNSELIKVTEKDGRRVVSARELHAFLEATERFSNWFERQIQYGFELNIDYVGCKEFNALANQVLTDYALTIDMAKEIAMLQRSDKGKQARLYFIECEKQLKSNSISLPNFNNPAEAARAWALEYEAKQQAQLEAKEAQENIKRLTHDAKTYTTSEIAKELNLKSANQLNKILEEKEIQYKLNGTRLLYAKYADLDYTSTKQIVLDSGHIAYDRRWTGKGRDFIINIFAND